MLSAQITDAGFGPTLAAWHLVSRYCFIKRCHERPNSLLDEPDPAPLILPHSLDHLVRVGIDGIARRKIRRIEAHLAIKLPLLLKQRQRWRVGRRSGWPVMADVDHGKVLGAACRITLARGYFNLEQRRHAPGFPPSLSGRTHSPPRQG